MRRRVFAVLFLLLCVAMAVLWVRSHLVGDQIWWGRVRHVPDGQEDASLCAGCDWGGVYVTYRKFFDSRDLLSAHPNNRRPEGPYKGRRSRESSGMYPYQGGRPGAPVAFRLTGFELTTGLHPTPGDPYRRQTVALVIPLWALILLTALPPALFVVQRVRRRTSPAGAQPCPRCGYDLRATPERCPECGESRCA